MHNEDFTQGFLKIAFPGKVPDPKLVKRLLKAWKDLLAHGSPEQQKSFKYMTEKAGPQYKNILKAQKP